jgi:hypothetical protein
VFHRQDLLLVHASKLSQQNLGIGFNLNNHMYPLDVSRNILKVIGFQCPASVVLDLMHYNFYRFLEHSPILPIVQVKPYVQYIMQHEDEFSKDIVYDIQHRWNFFLSMKMNAGGVLFHASNHIAVDPINYQLMENHGQSLQNFKFCIQPSFFPEALEEARMDDIDFLAETEFAWIRAQTLKHPTLSISVPLLSLSKIKKELEVYLQKEREKERESKSVSVKKYGIEFENYEKILCVGINESRRFWLHEIVEVQNKIDGNASLLLYESDLSTLIKQPNVSNCLIRV